MRRALYGVAALLAVLGCAVLPPSATGAASDGGGTVAWSQTKTLTRDWTDPDGTAKHDSREVTVQADRTTDLQARERVNISWSGAHPSGGRAANPYGGTGLNQEYPVVILQCRGVDDPSLPKAQQLRPDTCWTGTWPQRTVTLPDVSAAWTRDKYASAADVQQVSGVDTLPADCPAVAGDFDTHVTPFAAAGGKVYSGCTNETMPPEAAVGSADPPNELSAFTGTDGTGSAQFEVRTKAENESLGCMNDVPCSIVVVPIEGISCTTTPTDSPTATPSESPAPTSAATGDGGCNRTGSFAPGSSNFANDAVDLAVSPYLWWSASNWRNRFSIPLSFALPPSTCKLFSSGTPVTFYGSALLGQATLQWAPSYCLNAKRFNWQANVMPDEAAFSLMTNGGADAALVTGQRPLDGIATKVAYAPTAVSGFGIAFDIDQPDKSGQQTSLKLNARLLAKLLTMSYPASAEGATHPGLEHNPLSINLDPEFQELNPGLDATHGSEAASTLLSLSTSSDVISSITSYIADDPDAAAFMKGTADPYGMVVNPAYKDLKLPVSTWPIQDTFIPSTPGNPCKVANPAPYLPKVAAPVSTFAQISQAMLLSWPNVNTVCDTDPTTGLFKLGRIAPQGVGSRFMLGLVTLADAQRYGLPVAALQAAPGSYVTPNDASLAAAVQLATQPPVGKAKKNQAKKNQGSRAAAKVDPLGAFAVDQKQIRASTTAYPGMLVVSTAARLSGMDKDAAKRVSSFITISTSEGQVVGRGNGQLPQGYLPITRTGPTGKLYAAARLAAKRIAAQKAPAQ
ncbi:MAG: hypothetical protein JWO46_1625, partial [Nocardioidaceae bacterium]|nr:hypothetical protein [Nocardioidaceae bacterium]